MSEETKKIIMHRALRKLALQPIPDKLIVDVTQQTWRIGYAKQG